ncbi:choline ABC transporter ATP-binding protein [Novosphingobium beihaiensis]|uniref:Choline ABC transporter ATP-binding protein n=1 Tax=Novosphingobium beihaiensis TaxID=2930389 RepID=A0ABT0BTV1_9SPHN|nr:choline ABC transporter ATP-binding protein [Novosphingobium beihaiensis]MCJ2188469.1 choline ABC transporter ATP-binding protein [Novosphingobium beihaiensis]
MGTAIEFRDVDIFFAPGSGRKRQAALDRAMELAGQGKERSEISDETGVVLGVHNASLAVERGHISVLMGLSGSGKSTLLRAANGLNEVTRGQVLVYGEDGAQDIASGDTKVLRDIRRHRVAMVFQQFALLPWRTVRENVALGLELRGESKAAIDAKVEEQLELVGLQDWADSYASELSGGMQQRVGLARAFATDADILLMDEPFSALDPLIRAKLQDDLLELQRAVHKTILFVSHDLDEAFKLGDQITLLEGGRIVQSGSRQDILNNPATPYVVSFLEHMNPLHVMTGDAVMQPVEDLSEEDGAILLDEAGRYRFEDGRVSFEDEWHEVNEIEEPDTQEEYPEGFAQVSADTPVRTLMRIAAQTDNPVLLMRDGELAGVTTGQDILGRLSETGPASGEEAGDGEKDGGEGKDGDTPEAREDSEDKA